MQTCFGIPHVPSLSQSCSKRFGYVHLIIRDQVSADSRLHTSPKPCVYNYNDVATARLDKLDLAIARLGEMD